MSEIRRWLNAHPAIKVLIRLPRNLIAPVFDAPRLRFLAKYGSYFADLYRYRKLGGRAEIVNLFPILSDKTPTHSFDAHYFYQALWAARLISSAGSPEHVDVGSHYMYVGMLSLITKVKFIDIRPLGIPIQNVTEEHGSVLDMPMPNSSVYSLSCLHVAEHIGLGRYGDPLDPHGTVTAAKELSRILAVGGNLYFSLPIGRPRVEFNAHRVHTVGDVIRLFNSLALTQFSIVMDDGSFCENVSINGWDTQNFACGMFWFQKK